MRVLVVNQYFAPEDTSTGLLAADLCAGLARAGHEVAVVTGQPSYTAAASDAPAVEERDGVRIERVDLGRWRGRERMPVRLLGYGLFLSRASPRALRLAHRMRPDVVLTFHNPPGVGALGAAIARLTGARLVYVPHDLHPEVAIAAGWSLPAPAVLAWRALEDAALAQADRVVLVGEGMRETLVGAGRVVPHRAVVIPPWAVPELRPAPRDDALRAELGVGPSDRLLFSSGNMGVAQPPDVFFQAAHRLHERRARFVFAGDGARFDEWRARAPSHVRFLGRQPRERFVRLVAAADACLVALAPGLERLTVPSRASTFLSAGRALVTAMAPEADVARLVTSQRCGWNIRSAEELETLVESWSAAPEALSAAGARARVVYDERLARERGVARFLEVIEEALEE